MVPRMTAKSSLSLVETTTTTTITITTTRTRTPTTTRTTRIPTPPRRMVLAMVSVGSEAVSASEVKDVLLRGSSSHNQRSQYL